MSVIIWFLFIRCYNSVYFGLCRFHIQSFEL